MSVSASWNQRFNMYSTSTLYCAAGKMVFGPTHTIRKLYNLPIFSPKFTQNSQNLYTEMLARIFSIDFQ